MVPWSLRQGWAHGSRRHRRGTARRVRRRRPCRRPVAAIGRAPEGYLDRVFHCFGIGGRAGGAGVVLQRRSRRVSAFPGLLDLTVAGHLIAGERPLDGAREAREEVGLELTPDQLVPLGVRLTVFTSGEGRLDRELTHVFLARDDTPLEQYRPHPDDVDDLVEVGPADLLSVF